MEEQNIYKNYNLWILGVGLMVAIFLGYKFLSPSNKVTENQEVAKVAETATTPTPTAIPSWVANDIEKHSTKDDCWVVVNGKVYDVTTVISIHPGGEKAITNWCGKDASVAFNNRGGKGPHGASAVEALEKKIMGLFEVSAN